MALKISSSVQNFYENPKLCIAAYPFLVLFETLNLGRLYEGIYFGIPSQNILDIMLGVS